MSTGRYAPSPSGRMHLGNLMCCLLAWLSAKSKGGQVLLRIEDLDTQRCPRSYADAIVDDLAWLGLAADGPTPPVYQSDRSEIYQRYFDELSRRGLVYPCFCSRSQLHAASAPHRSDGQVIYAGTCRGLTPAEIAERSKIRAPAWRVQVPDEVIAFEDGHMGHYEENLARDCGDFFLRRAAAEPALRLRDEPLPLLRQNLHLRADAGDPNAARRRPADLIKVTRGRTAAITQRFARRSGTGG